MVNVRSLLPSLAHWAKYLLPEPEPDDLGLILTYLVWGLWLCCLCLLAIIARWCSESITNLQFAEGTGITSAIAIVLTLRSGARSKRLHSVMLVLCCLLYFGCQRPTAYTPHGAFVRTFHSVQRGMTVKQVRSIMAAYAPNDQPLPWWSDADYSGKVSFQHHDYDSVDGFYDVTFTEGRVTKTLFYDD